ALRDHAHRPVGLVLVPLDRGVALVDLDRLIDELAAVELAVEADLPHVVPSSFFSALGAASRFFAYFSSQLMAMPSGSSKASSVKSKLSRSSSVGGPIAPAIACIVTDSMRARFSCVIWWRQAALTSSL